MRCEEIQFELPLYAEGSLDADQIAIVEDHLPSCPLCRSALGDYSRLRSDIGKLPAWDLKPEEIGNLKAVLRSEIAATAPGLAISGRFHTSWRDRIHHWMMPFSVGTVAASLLTAMFLFVTMSELGDSVEQIARREAEAGAPLFANANINEMRRELSFPEDLSAVKIAETPPELNRNSGLLALSNLLVKKDDKDGEVVIVADVFGNGLAKIAGVVDPPADDEVLLELQKAFETDPSDTPFVPNKDLETVPVRIVFKIQRVDVSSEDEQ
ncbi:MAG: zf-HC2 domain-containing protein [Pyrinomonadaceae bacterium]